MTATNTDRFSFGALLKAFRKRRRLTQQQLAEAIGVHRSAIVRWEQGDFLPQSKALVLETAGRLHLDEPETRQLLEASLTALSPYWLVPFPRNPFFTGREEILEDLQTHLDTDHVVALTQSYALQGLGGVGKTQIALEYAYRHALEYNAVFWLGAETEEQIISSLLHVAEVLQLSERTSKDQQQVIAAVQGWLSTHSQWLVICDNVEELELLLRFLPAARSGATLITTRHQVLGTFAQGLDLFPMEQEEAVAFLLRRAKMLSVGPETAGEQVRQFAAREPIHYATAVELVRIMGRLPLALDQAGAYLEATQCGLPTYLNLFRTRRSKLLQQRGEGSHDHPESVSTTFALAVTATAGRHPAIEDLLRVCALLQPDAIPEELFLQGGAYLGPVLEAICRDELEWNNLLAVACSYSLLHRQSEKHTLSLHRLVQAVLLDAMAEEEREQWNQRTIKALDKTFPEVQPTTEHTARIQCERLLPHVLLCLHRVDEAWETLTVASLAYKAAMYLRVRGRYAEAEPLLQRGLRIRERILGPDHIEVASLLNSLANLYWSQSNYMHVEPLLQRALRIREHVLGPDDHKVAASLNNLAILYQSQGNYTQAEPLLLRALHISERIQGTDHLDVARPLNNLASLYWNQGNYTQAEPLLLRALRILEQHLGPDHPEVARPLNSLASLYWSQGNYMHVESLYLRAILILEQGLGPDHPDLAHPLNNLGEFYLNQGKYTEAEPLSLRALHISEQALGSDHPDVARPLNNLANLHREQGKSTQAESLYKRALCIQEQHLGLHHPETAQTLYDLAVLRQKQDNLGEAFSLTEQALLIYLQALGEAHPKTIALHTLLAQLRKAQDTIQGGTSCPHGAEEHPDYVRIVPLQEETALTPQKMSNSSLAESDPLQEFLAACCELHPHAWCGSNGLWKAYQCWVEASQERYPLSRGAFIAQLKKYGCRADRTKKMRIWRGIALVNNNGDG